MNGNDLNNMTQRYKEEMMRLYQQSASRQNGNSGSNMNSMNRSTSVSGGQQNTAAANSSADMQGTAAQNMNGTPYYSSGNNNAYHGHHDHHGSHNGMSVNVPVNCDCRFPSAESIINQMASTPATLPLTPEDYANGVNTVSGSNVSAATRSANNGGNGADTDPSGNVSPRGIMINTARNVGTYAVPSQSEDEREIMPDFSLPSDIPAESSEVTPSTRNFTPSLGWISLTGDNSWGFLQFEVFTGEQGYPVQGALVTIKKKLPGGTGLARILFTNRSGLTPTIALPAPSSSLSLNPNSGTRPFSEYTVTVRAAGYYSLTDINLPVFAGVKTVQPIDLIPLPSFGTTPIQPRTDSNGSTSVG